jgi:hypothetical protein
MSLCFTLSCLAAFSAPVYSQDKRPTLSKDKRPSSPPGSKDEEENEASRPTSTGRGGDRDLKMDMAVRYWAVSPKASAGVSDGANVTGAGARASLGMDLAHSPEIRTTMHFSKNNRMRVDFLQMKTGGNGDGLTVNLPGDDFLADNDIARATIGQADLDIKQLRIGYSWQGIRIGKWVKFGPMVEARGLLFNARYVEQPGGTSGAAVAAVTDSGLLGGGAFTAGVDATVRLHRRMEMTALILGVPVGGLGRVFDVDAEVRYSISRNFYFSGAYRYMRIRGEDGAYFGELRFRGPAVGVGFRF